MISYLFLSHSNPPSTDFGRLSPARGYQLLGIKTSPYTSPIGTPGPGVIKFEPGTGGLEDHNEHELRMDSGRATPTHGPWKVPKTQPRHGNGDNDDDDSNDEEPCDLRMDLTKALLAAAAHESGAVALALGHHTHHLSQPQHHHQQQPSQHSLSRARPHLIFTGGAATGQDPSSSAAAVIVAAAAAGLAANNTSASVAGAAGGSGSITGGGASGGASTSAAAAAAAAMAAAVPAGWSGSGGGVSSGGVGGNTSSGGGGGGGGGAYACDRCGNTYARPHSLNRHVRFECGVEPKFECPICHKKSKHKHNLVLHMRTHQHR